jgi:hypothetical protein
MDQAVKAYGIELERGLSKTQVSHILVDYLLTGNEEGTPAQDLD